MSAPENNPTAARSDESADFGDRRLAAIVFSDVVGYSARMQVDERTTLLLVQSDFQQMRRLCAQHGGKVLKSTGDGLLLCFDSVVGAVECALAIQAGFAGRAAAALQHRMGIHLGDVYHQAGDVAGDGVNLAARLQTAAQPGTICVSDAVFAVVQGKVRMESRQLAPLVLKNIAQPFPAHLIAPVGARLTALTGARGVRRRRGWAGAAVAAALLVAVAGFLFNRMGKPAAPAAVPIVTNAALAEFPREPDLRQARKLIYAMDGIAEDFRLADSLVKPLLTARPNDPEVVTVAAEVAGEFLARGFDQTQPRRAEAQRLTERAVQLAPENPDALAALGTYLYFIREQPGRAEKLLRQAIQLNPREARYYRVLSLVLQHSRPGAETDAFGARMVELFPADPLVAYDTALRYSRAADPNLARVEEWLDKSIRLAPVENAIFWKAKFMLEVRGDVEGMKRTLDLVPERQRTSARLVGAYAVLATVTGQTAPARHLLDSIADTWMNDSSYVFPKALLLGDLERLDGHDDVARLHYEAALQEVRSKQALDPADLRQSRPELWVQIGLGRRAEARAALQVNLQLRPRPYRWTINFNWWSSALRGCLVLGERADALTLLKEAGAEAQGRLLLRNLFHVDPAMAPFRDDPEIMALLAEPEAKK